MGYSALLSLTAYLCMWYILLLKGLGIPGRLKVLAHASGPLVLWKYLQSKQVTCIDLTQDLRPHHVECRIGLPWINNPTCRRISR